MGKLIKNHWARLIILTASIYQIAAAVEGFFWPKIFWDFATKNLDGAVKPIPVLQVLNLLLGIVGLLWEWPLKPLAKLSIHRSIEARLALYPVSALMGLLLYQGTNPGIYYLVGVCVYFWAYSEGEVCGHVPFVFIHSSIHPPPTFPCLDQMANNCFLLYRVYHLCRGRYRREGALRPGKRSDLSVLTA
jgi:hypothetical protein